MSGPCVNCKKKPGYIKRNCRCTNCANCCKNIEKEDNNKYSAIEKALKVDHFPFLSKLEKELPSFSNDELLRLKELVEKAIEKTTTPPGSAPPKLDVQSRTVGDEPVKVLLIRGKPVKVESLIKHTPLTRAKRNRQARQYNIGVKRTAKGSYTLVAHKKQEAKIQDNHTIQPKRMKKPEEE